MQIYRVCEDLTEVLIYAMVVFGPWAFGTTQPWSIWLMNSAGYLLGVLLAGKWIIRHFKGYHPPRWGTGGGQRAEGGGQRAEGGGRRAEVGIPTVCSSPSSFQLFSFSAFQHFRWSAVLALMTVAILVYCLVSAVNARSTFLPNELSFAYSDSYLKWLPHSFDSNRTWLAFWSYLGLAGSFWAVRDWLLGKSAGEERAEHGKSRPGVAGVAPPLPARLRRLLWVLALNGALLGLEGIVQRLEGSGKLLFLVKPRVNPGADAQFGPYAYRANAAQYFNLLWPVCLGFWWTLSRSFGVKRQAYHLLLVCCVIMAACPIISTSRAGAVVTVGIIALAAFFLSAAHFLLAARRQPNRKTQTINVLLLCLFFTGALTLGFALGWKTLKPRMDHLSGDSKVRERMYEIARPMAADYPLFGTGPGTFTTVFQLYRISTDTYWPAQLHNDWLETRITFGWFGSGLIALTFLMVLLRWFARGGIHGGRRFTVLVWLALGGCLAHARYDFPFQIHSIVFLFLVLCAITSILSRRP